MLNDINMNHNRLIAGKNTMPKLSTNEIRATTDAYVKMFRALTYQNLLNGKTLGKSWHDATKQMESFVGTKDEFNPAAKQINDILMAHKKDIAKQSMTNPNRDKVVQIDPAQREKLQERVSADLESGKNNLNKMIEKYQPVAAKVRTEMKKLEQEKAKLAEKQQAKDKQIQPVQAPKKTPAEIAQAKEKTNKFADATKKLDTMTMEQMKVKLMLALQRQNQQRVA